MVPYKPWREGKRGPAWRIPWKWPTGAASQADTLVVCGVRFMGTVKILNPEKRVLMPDLAATCSLDEKSSNRRLRGLCDQHSGRKVVVYANTSAAVKARSDWVVTSGIALAVVEHLHRQGEKVLWAPDRHLGQYVARLTGADMLSRPGACAVHQEFKSVALQRLCKLHPDAAVLVHPQSPTRWWIRRTWWGLPPPSLRRFPPCQTGNLLSLPTKVFSGRCSNWPRKNTYPSSHGRGGRHLRKLWPLSLDGYERLAKPGASVTSG